VVGGGIFPVEKFRTLSLFDRAKVVNSVRYVDKVNGTYVVEHVFRRQWSIECSRQRAGARAAD
jgi:hypothetical protein